MDKCLRNNKKRKAPVALSVFVGVVVLTFATMGLDGLTKVKKLKPLRPIPEEYANHHMPDGWWTDPKIIKEGEDIFQGRKYGSHNVSKEKRVKCAKCHGKNGKPRGIGPCDMRSGKRFNRISDSYWFWRISEGVPRTKMRSWKARLTEEERWKVMAYEHQFSHGGKAAVHDHPEIERSTKGA